ncbi:alpha-mannosyltransferase [Cyberlindnera jadinii NRRL Y-1542]|uniref:Nucleotide-diphospho-sugar transferase n=1 Tax=Cyberlindnera jadinii (strain ATCC 18201 / CBS 1600 / BCRC 20928 / JCM 3617 / NBRC 0987 / NRRL Y-1542) TaxID=983966 RepID=A0A1E4S3Z1_CYBJN|nr:nucleotide-diphospho-sugar transferase [Cyberlindnera jadinii NRRL Y-1542]ODV74246.1 nucleotide-diphospho-sugar transferase [Cyberlindnera jadinii NRRL Y-1542]
MFKGIGSPRHRRLLMLLAFVVSLGYLTSAIFQRSSSAKFDKVAENFQQFLGEYFYSDDNNVIVEQLVKADSDSLPEAVAEHLKKTGGALMTTSKKQAQSQEFYSNLIRSLYSKKSEIPKLELEKRASDHKSSFWSKKELLSYLAMDHEEVARLQSIHKSVSESLPTKFPKGLYKGTGIVMIGGGRFSWLSLLSIKSMRSFGCKLPVELIIPTSEEYEYDFCEEILPALGGSCVLLQNVLGTEIMKDIPFKGYQYKSLALLASSFDNTLFLDSDNVLVSNPDKMFNSEPFLSKGFVSWPDYWERTTSPYLYEIMGIQVNETVRVNTREWPLPKPEVVTDPEAVPFHELQGAFPELSTESGQILIRKSDHVKTLCLALFYNLFGPEFFYPLISQGADGEGDKDTFVIAAINQDESYYQVHSNIKTFGWVDTGTGNFNGVAMGQRDPTEDYEMFEAIANSQNPNWEEFDKDRAKVFTVHANYPKLDPFLLHKEEKLKNSNGQDFRMYSDVGNFLPYKFDFELVQYKRMKFMLCDLNLSLKYFNEITRAELCQFIESHLEYLLAHPMEFSP